MNRLLTPLTVLMLTALSPNLQAQNPPPGAKPKTAVKTAPANGQTTPGNSSSIASQSETSRTLADEAADTAIERRLVELALQGPEYEAATHQGKVNEYKLKETKNAWLNLLAISANYNDQTFAQQNPNSPVVYPKYFIGITIPLGVIFSQGTNVKAAREGVALGKNQQEELARQLKANVLGKYKQFKMYTSLIEMQRTMNNDVEADYSQAKDGFEKGTVTVEAYILAQRTRNEELTKDLNLRLQRDLVRLEIERIIGVPLDEVLHTGANFRPAPAANQ
jgi:outer membrane protein TolC